MGDLGVSASTMNIEAQKPCLPEESADQVNSAGCLTLLGEREASLCALGRAAQPTPGDPTVNHKRRHALGALRRVEDAERAYDEALAGDHRLMPSLIARAGL